MKILLLLACLLCSGSSMAVSRPCSQFAWELAQWGITVDRTLEINLGPVADRPYNQLPSGARPFAFDDVRFHISESNVAQVARLLSMDYPADYLERGLRENLERGYTEVPLLPFLPQRVQKRFGRKSTDSCYIAAFGFHEDIPRDLQSALNRGVPGAIVNRYSILGYQDEVRFGDLLIFRSFPDAQGKSTYFHAAVYLGGDLVYHKLNPTPWTQFEFVTLASLIRLYSNSEIGAVQNAMPDFFGDNIFRFGEPFVIQTMRYDPNHERPPARRVPGRGEN